MKNLILLSLTVLVLSACGKSVSSSPPDDTGITAGKALTLIFANHGEPGTNETIYSSSRFTQSMTVTAPINGLLISFSSQVKPDLQLRINNQLACTYRWNSTTYAALSGCINKFSVSEGDVATVTGIPQGQTVTVTLRF